MIKVPSLDLGRQYQPIRQEIEQAIKRVCESQRFILGPEVDALEGELSAVCGFKHAIGVSSGTDALLVSLMALGIGAGDEVITTPFSFFATTAAIARLGAKPVFVDIDPTTFNLDVNQIEKKITPKTRAIVPVYLFGQCAKMTELLALSERHGVEILEDAAQSILAQSDGRQAGTMGKLGAFSFYPSKNLGAFGDAGLVSSSDEELAEKVRALRVHGETRRYHHRYLGGNFRLDEIQAAVLRVKLRYLGDWTEQRRSVAMRYNQYFVEQGLVLQGSLGRNSEQIDPITLPLEKKGQFHVYNQYVIRARMRDALVSYLTERQIGVSVYYPIPLHLQECFLYLDNRLGDFPESERAAKEVLALPIFPELTTEEQLVVVRAISEFYKVYGF